MDSQQLERQAAFSHASRRACLVDGCTCKDARIVSQVLEIDPTRSHLGEHRHHGTGWASRSPETVTAWHGIGQVSAKPPSRVSKPMSTGFFLAIAGNIGVGKTELTNRLSAELGWAAHYEPVIQNPYLDPFYQDMPRWSFHLQIYFLSERFKAQVERNWFPLIPQAAMSMSGHVVLTFNVHKSGMITDLIVAKPARIDGFNHAAYGAMVSSNPTIPLPPEYPADKAFFTVTFFYNEAPP